MSAWPKVLEVQSSSSEQRKNRGRNCRPSSGFIRLFVLLILIFLCSPHSIPATEVSEKIKAARAHWAFQPVTSPAIPKVRKKSWVQSPIDAFVLAQLEKYRLPPARPADKRTLLRRATYDLIGLPPTPEEVAAFEKDKSPDAFAKVVERLLASPHYGERWGRHWLDVARYADTKGDTPQQDNRYPYAYTYRNWVIQAFNDDLPYDQFLVQQIAADQLLGSPPSTNNSSLAALGFVTVGRRFLNNFHDTLDDRIDVVMRGTMALTVSCARCHDHKYDPIPTADYYSLYGVLVNSIEPAELPLLNTPLDPKAHQEYLDERKKCEADVAKLRETKIAEVRTTLRKEAGEYLLVGTAALELERKNDRQKLAQENKLKPLVVARWSKALKSWGKESSSPGEPLSKNASTSSNTPAPVAIFTPWFAFAELSETNFTTEAPVLATKFSANKDGQLNPIVARAFAGATLKSLPDVAEIYGKLLNEADRLWLELLKTQTNATALADADQEALRQILYSANAPANVPADEFQSLLDQGMKNEIKALEKKAVEVDVTHPGSPPRAMSLNDAATNENAKIFIRGSAENSGPEVPRQFLAILSGEKREPFQKGSGRLELAQAITSRENPLTARVLVNRVWMHHFGKPLVETPGDFGLRSEPPSHPELLDHLAWRFMEEGWSIKKLHRWMMLSSVYQQKSDVGATATASLKKDSENRLLWKMNKGRLDFETMRDTLLVLGGKMDATIGGRASDLIAEPFSLRRTVYGFVDRQSLPGLFRAFDFASPDTPCAVRFETTVPQQALFLMNSRFVEEQAGHFIARPEFQERTENEKLRLLYQFIYQREPEKKEITAAKHFLASDFSREKNESARPTAAWKQLVQVLLLSNELAFVD